MVPAAYTNNEISYEHDFYRKMEKYTRALADALDKGAIAALEAQKTQILKDKLNYDFSGNVIKVKKEMATEILGDIDPIMRANCYPRMPHIVCNAFPSGMLPSVSAATSVHSSALMLPSVPSS